MNSITYPTAHRVDIVDDYHGTAVPDPYRWLENPDTPETQAWITAQNQITRQFIDAVPQRSMIQQRLTELWNYPKYFAPMRKGKWLFYYKNDGLQNQAVLYRTTDLHDPAVVALDPNELTKDGTAAITSLAISNDGTQLAYGVSFGGSDRQEIHIRNLETGVNYPEVLHHCRFASIAWKQDETGQASGFFYNRDPQPDPANPTAPPLHNKVFWHQPGTPQTEDTLIYERPDAPVLKFPPQISEDGRFLIFHVWHAAISRNRLYYRDLTGSDQFIHLIDEADAYYNFIGNVGDTFYIQTDWHAPNGRLIAIDLTRPQRNNWHEVLPETADVLVSVNLVNGQLAAVTMHHACHQIKLYELDGSPTGDIELPPLSTVTGLWGEQNSPDYFFKVESYLDAGTVFHYRLDTQELQPVWQTTTASFQRSEYETSQVFFPSKDGTQVSMFLTHKKGLSRNNNNPVLLYGYGGYNINHTPTFAAHAIYWIESGGIFADVNLRGGGEYGEAWHQAGMLAHKQNVFDDFIAAAAWLSEVGYTRPEKLAIIGRSNGGLLTSAVMIQRPDLFGAVLSVVPVTDMLRFHKFTAGRYWTDEYGNAEEYPEHFRFMIAYSPLHNVRTGVIYPPILLTTADGDDRVVPMHAMKFTATLQAAASHITDNVNPILIRVDTKSGHGLGKPTSKWINEWADIYAFLQVTIQNK